MKSATQNSSYGTTINGGNVDFLVWAPLPEKLTLRLLRRGGNAQDIPMRREGEDFVTTAEALAGDRYTYVFPDGVLAPDPVSRFLPASKSI